MLTKREKNVRIYSIVYLVAAIVLLIGAIALSVFFMVLNTSMSPEFTNYGNGDVEGYATIISGIGFLTGWFGKAVFYFLQFLCLALAGYWVVGIVVDLFLMRSVKKQKESAYKGLGTALSIWTIIPGAALLLMLTGNSDPTAAAQVVVTAAVFLAAGIFLLVLLRKKEA